MGAARDDVAARSAVLGAHDVDSEPPDAATGVPAHGNRRRVGPAICGDRCARVGQRRRFFLPRTLGDDARDRPRRGRCRARSSPLGEQRADDVLLLCAGARGAARVRPGRVARATTVRAPAACRIRRHGNGGRHLPRLQHGHSVRARLGNRDVDRHGLRARTARARGAASSRPPAGVHPHGCRGRRHPRARRHRNGLHRAGQGFGAARCPGCLRSGPRRARPPRASGLRLRGARGSDMGDGWRCSSRAWSRWSWA
jgi:hypothetical protein